MTVTEPTADTADRASEVDEVDANDEVRDDSQSEVVDDVLVEEISIDGMCGVY